MSYLETIDTLVKEVACLKMDVRELKYQVSKLEDRLPPAMPTLRCEPIPTVVCSSCTYFGRNGCPEHGDATAAVGPRHFTCRLG